jgi:hypothetical protein
MSHFSLLVIGEDVASQLAPFDENEPSVRKLEYTKAELIKSLKQSNENYRKGTYALYLEDPEGYATKNSNHGAHLKYLQEGFPKRLKMTDKELYDEAITDYTDDMIDKDGGVYTTYNQDSRWDWYEIGGRWTGALKLKKGKYGEVGSAGLMTPDASPGTCDQAMKKDIDWDRMNSGTKEQIEHHKRFWAVYVLGGKPENEKEKKFSQGFVYKPEYYKERYKTVENYVKSVVSFSTYAVLKDGEWHGKGEMGWFGCGNESHDEALDYELNFMKKFIDGLDKNEMITMVDCHI